MKKEISKCPTLVDQNMAQVVTTVTTILDYILDIAANAPSLLLPFKFDSIYIVIILTVLIFLILNKVKVALFFLFLCIVIHNFYPKTSNLSLGEAWVYVLDVSQGLSVIIKTKDHLLIFDTGKQFHSGFNYGSAAVIPFLQSINVSSIDAVVISHEDLEQRGGLPAILKYMPVKKIIRNNKVGSHENCFNEPSWQWDGVKFEFLKINNKKASQNNKSCVLKVSNQKQSILLPGDIEKEADKKYLKRYGTFLNSTTLISPHHGSKTSSTQAFIETVAPNYIFISTGKYNRYQLPHKGVIERYRVNNIQHFDTSSCGMISWKMNNKSKLAVVNFYQKY